MANPGVKTAESSALSFMNSLQAESNQQFQGQQAALSAINNAWAPILAGGAIPAGYSAGLDSLLQSQIRDNGAQGTANAEDKAALLEKQGMGGASGELAGAQEAIDAQIEATGQQATAKNLQAEKTADYAQGVTDLEGATNAELGVAGTDNPSGTAGAANQAGSLGLTAAQAQWQENQTTSPLNLTSDILGDVGKAAGDITGIGDVASMFSTPSAPASNPYAGVSIPGYGMGG